MLTGSDTWMEAVPASISFGTRQVSDQECATCWKERRGSEGTGPCVEGSRSASGGARHQDFGHPGRPPRTRSQILAHIVRRADPLGRRRASSLVPPGSLCGGESDIFVAVCRPRGRVRQEARPGRVGVLEFHSSRLRRRSEGHRTVANVFGRFGCPLCSSHQQDSPLGHLGRLVAHDPASWCDSWSTRQRHAKLPATLLDWSTFSMGA